MYRNSEGYASPTEGAAYAHIEYEERKKRREEHERLKKQESEKQVKLNAEHDADRQLLAKYRREQEQQRLDQMHWELAWSRNGLSVYKPVEKGGMYYSECS